MISVLVLFYNCLLEHTDSGPEYPFLADLELLARAERMAATAELTWNGQLLVPLVKLLMHLVVLLEQLDCVALLESGGFADS